jgi:hypothetical protein
MKYVNSKRERLVKAKKDQTPWIQGHLSVLMERVR